MDDEPSGVPPELPTDHRAYLRPFRWPLMYGPWALGVIGLMMIAAGLFLDRPSPVALTVIGFGAAMIIAGVLLPRMRGTVELGPSGVKGAVEGLPEALMLVAVTAKEAAEQAIPEDAPDKERKVNEVVGHTVSYLAFMSEPEIRQWVSELTESWYRDLEGRPDAWVGKGIPEEVRRARGEAIRRRTYEMWDRAYARKPENAAKKAKPPARREDG
jgi:hypothetical protein